MVKYTRMEENKRVYDAQYDTDEYESLTCECHHLARAKELNGSRRKPFFCIHCKTVYKDKNKLNLHRLEGCLAVTNDGTKTVLKIYPVFGKGQRGEIEDILIKHGLMNPRKKPSRAKRKKSASAALKETSSYPSMEEVDMATVQEEQTPLRPQKLKVRGMLLSSSSSQEAKKEHKDSDVHIFYGHHEQQQQAVVDKNNNNNNNPSSGGSPVVGGRGEMQVQMQLTREQVEAQAREVAHYMQQDASMVSCPEGVPCPGLWHLMQFQLLPSGFPDVKDDSFLQAFFDFVDKGLIDPGLRSSYGTWYMERELQENAGEEEQKAVKLTMSRFKLVGGRPDVFARHMEKTALQAFLQYQTEWVRYEAQMEKELQLRREKYVKDRLDDFDAREHAHKELAVWHWSPLLHLLKSDAIGGVPPKPWLHSDAEQKKIAHAVQVDRMMIVTDPPPCPLIVRMFKIVYLYCFYKNNTLSDPVTGLLRETMLGYSSSETAAPVLQISAQSVLNEGCFLFTNLPPSSEGHDDVFRDINSLLHGTIIERENVVQKVQVFLKIVRQRAVGDMAMLHPKEFRVLWCGGDQAEIGDALKMFMHCLKSREDLDMGWVPFPSGHLDHNSVAVMQAREAVLSAIHKLHDQRVLLDKSRMMTASARIDEKFQALVETCVGKSSRRNSVDDSGDGSLGKDEDQDERPSSYTTTSGSADSRSSHEMKDTGIDVERPQQHLIGEPSRKKTFNSSPDLNLNLDSNDSFDPGASPIVKCDTTLTAHMAGLHVVKPVKTVSVLGVEVQASDPDIHSSIPPYPHHHFYGPCSKDVQSPQISRVYVPSNAASVLRPSPADSVHVNSSVNNNPPAGRRCESSFGAETSAASGNQALVDKYTVSSRHPHPHLLFTTQSSFSTTSTASTYNETTTLRDSSATPVLTVALQDPDEEP